MKKSMVPTAYIFTDEVHDRFINTYATHLSEVFTVDEALKIDDRKLPNLYNVAFVTASMQLTYKTTKIFVIYNPNKKHLVMSQIADSGKVKVLVDSLARQNLLATYRRDIENIKLIRSHFHLFESEHKKLQRLKTWQSSEAKKAKKDIQIASEDISRNISIIIHALRKSFAKDFLF